MLVPDGSKQSHRVLCKNWRSKQQKTALCFFFVFGVGPPRRSTGDPLAPCSGISGRYDCGDFPRPASSVQAEIYGVPSTVPAQRDAACGHACFRNRPTRVVHSRAHGSSSFIIITNDRLFKTTHRRPHGDKKQRNSLPMLERPSLSCHDPAHAPKAKSLVKKPAVPRARNAFRLSKWAKLSNPRHHLTDCFWSIGLLILPRAPPSL